LLFYVLFFVGLRPIDRLSAAARHSLAFLCPFFAGLRPAPYQRGERPLWNLYDGNNTHDQRLPTGIKQKKTGNTYKKKEKKK
jgi:hypothetical protein